MHALHGLVCPAASMSEAPVPSMVERVESKTSNSADIALNVKIPQFEGLSETSPKATVDAKPLPKIVSPGRSPRKVSNDPITPGTKSPKSSAKKKSPLPRVATLAQASPKPRIEPKKSPPPFRAGGKVTPGKQMDGMPTRRSTPSRRTSSSSGMTYDHSTSRKSSMRSTAGTLASRSSAKKSSTDLPRRSATPPTAPKRTIVKPPESITRAIKESQALSKMDSLNSSEDTEMQSLREILQDIKTIKTELGVEGGKGDETSPQDSAANPNGSEMAGIDNVDTAQSENITVSFMTDVPAGTGPDEAQGPRREPDQNEVEQVRGGDIPATTEPPQDDKAAAITDVPETKASSCACCTVM